MSYSLGQTDYVRSSRSAMGQLAYTARRSLGQTVTTTTTSEPMSDGAKIAVGVGAFALLGGIGWLAYRFPMPSFGMGGGYGYGGGGPYLGIGPGGGRGGISLQLNRGKRRRRKR